MVPAPGTIPKARPGARPRDPRLPRRLDPAHPRLYAQLRNINRACVEVCSLNNYYPLHSYLVAMAARRRIGRRSTINPGIILLSASNLLSEIEYLQPSSLEMRDIGALIDRVRAVKQNLRRLRSGSVEQRILDRITRGLDEMRRYLEEIKKPAYFFRKLKRIQRSKNIHR